MTSRCEILIAGTGSLLGAAAARYLTANGHEPECPVDAIFQAEAVPPELAEYIDLNRRWFEAVSTPRRPLASAERPPVQPTPPPSMGWWD